MIRAKTMELRDLQSLESNLLYIQSVYKKMVLKKAKMGKPINRLVERLKSVEIQLWMIRKSKKDVGQKAEVSNGL